jgi:hypothetical protein
VDRFDNMRVFVKVVESNSFAGAAAEGLRSILPDLPFLVAHGVHPRQRIR